MMKSVTNNLPPAKIYEKEYSYWPWGKLIRKVQSWVIDNAPNSAYIIDYMCGTGYLLNEIVSIRKDLAVEGCSITSDYVEFAGKKYPNITVLLSDVMEFKPRAQPTIIIATGGLHHLYWNKQVKFIEKVASELNSGNYFLLGEEAIRDHEDKKSRQLAVLELSFNLLQEVVSSSAPEEVIEAAANLLKIDLFERGEYKNSLHNLCCMLKSKFVIERIEKVWPNYKGQFGDYLIIARKK